MSKHTPGAWKWGSGWQDLESEPRDFRQEFSGPKYADLSLSAGNKTIIGIGIDHWNIRWDSKNELVDFTNADRALISAAPELLAALKAVQFGFDFRRCPSCGGWDMSPNGETDMVHTKTCIVGLAIAKAEGK